MAHRQNHKKPLITDKTTDFMFEQLMNEDKFNEQYRPELDEQQKKKMDELNEQIKNNNLKIPTIKEETENSHSTHSVKNGGDVDFDNNKTDTNSEHSNGSFKRTPFKNKINASDTRSDTKTPPQQHRHESNDEKRSRALNAYSKLQMLVMKGVSLTKEYYPTDDPDVMEEEYNVQMSLRNRYNNYTSLRNIIIGGAWLFEKGNDNLNPFDWKLTGWHQQLAGDTSIDDPITELSEKWFGGGSQWSPEFKLLFALATSAAFYGMSQNQQGGVASTISSNPQIASQLMNMMNGAKSEPEKVTPNHRDLVSDIRNRNKNKNKTTEESSNNDIEQKLHNLEEALKNKEKQTLDLEYKMQHMMNEQSQLKRDMIEKSKHLNENRPQVVPSERVAHTLQSENISRLVPSERMTHKQMPYETMSNNDPMDLYFDEIDSGVKPKHIVTARKDILSPESLIQTSTENKNKRNTASERKKHSGTFKKDDIVKL
jgi:hypothetical protein